MRRTRTIHRTPRGAPSRALAAATLLLTGLAGAASPAAAQPLCAQRSEVAAQLRSRHAETPVALGIAANGGVVEVFSAGDGSTWTLVITMPDGTSCMLAVGEAWENLPRVAAGPKA